jgi:TRAP transporter TAXI family solute receptor
MLGLLLFSACARQQPGETGAKQRISIATGGTGGTYYPYGGAMANIINQHVPGAEATAEVTGASVENLRLVDRGEAQLGLCMNDAVFNALKGIGEFDRPLEVRTLFAMYPHFLHVVTLEGYPIKSIADLKGKKVSVGAPGSGTEIMSRQVLESLGITYDDFKVFRLSFAENTEALRDKVIDVGIWSVGPPASSIMDLATTHKIRLISFTDEELAKIEAQHPYYSPMELPAGTYQGVDYAAKAPSVWNSVVVSKDMPEDLAYQIVKAIFENVEELIRVYPGAKYTTPEATLQYAVAPLHPGVVRYMKELKHEVPGNLLPPEMK